MIKSPHLDPDPDNLRGGPSHGHNTSCVKNQVNQGNSLSYPSGQTYRHTQTQIHYPHTSLQERNDDFTKYMKTSLFLRQVDDHLGQVLYNILLL